MSANGLFLHARGLVKDYPAREGKGTLRVLDGADVDISRKSTVAVTGASGSGKSTLLHLLGGLDRPTSGFVKFRDTDYENLSKDELALFRNKNLGFVFQFHHLLPEFSALENVFMPALISGLEKDQQKMKDKAADLLERFQLGDRTSHRPSELSGGEQQRVAVARALMNDPDVIMADEPTGNLDEVNTSNLLDILFSLVEERDLTLIMVTHDQSIAKLCDYTYRLERGRVVD